MLKKIIVFIGFFVLMTSGEAFAQMRELSFSEKIENATAIFEGKVIRKNSFWNYEHTLIFTSNTIEVYKIFKENTTITSEVEIITEGGQVGEEMQDAESTLILNEGNIGVFMVEASKVVNPQTKESKNSVFRVYGGPQGFIKYDLLEKTASDPFRKYTNISDEVYKVIIDKTGQHFREIKAFNIVNPNGTNPTKKRTWFSCCKKKKMSK